MSSFPKLVKDCCENVQRWSIPYVLAIQSPELAEAFSDESDEVPLTDPDAVSTPA